MSILSSIDQMGREPVSPSDPHVPWLASWFTVERALYALLILAAAGIRLFLLTGQPFNSLEATNAWHAWLITNGNVAQAAIAPDSPLLHALYTLAFWLFGAGEYVARALPVLCGVGSVWLLWYWRQWLGRLTALIAATLLCIDPWFTFYSRLADSVAITIFCGLLVLTALLRLAELTDATGRAAQVNTDETDEASDIPAVDHVLEIESTLGHWQRLFAIGLGLLVISGPQMWSWLGVLVLFGLFVLPTAARQLLLTNPIHWVLTVGVAIIGATGWLARPEGLGALSTSLTVWLSQWSDGNAEAYSLGWLLIRMITDQPLLILFGLIGLGQGWLAANSTGNDATQRGRTTVLTLWLLWGLLLVLVPGRGPLALAMVGLPLLFFAAHALATLVVDMQSGVQWQVNGLLLLVLGVLFISFAFFLATFANARTFDVSLARTLLLIGVLSLLLVVAYALWIDGRQARIVIGSGVAVILLCWTISSAWALNHFSDLRHPDGFFQSYTNPDVRELADAVEMLSAQRFGDATELPLQVEMVGTPDPVLGWYLRDMRNLEWVLAPGSSNGQNPPVIITLPGSTGIDGLSTGYLGSEYALHDQWLPTQLTAGEVAFTPDPAADFLTNLESRFNARWTAQTRKLLRWMIYHKVETLPPTNPVTLWVATAPEVN